MCVIVYLDDSIGMAQRDKASKFAEETLQQAGFVAHLWKSQWQPSTSLQWLGFVLDSNRGQIRVPEDKVSKLQCLLLEAKHLRHIKAKCVASFTCKIISMWLGLGDIVRLMTRALYRLLQSRASWCDILRLDVECMREIEFWLDNIGAYNRQSLWHSPSAVRIVFSDASDTGYGGYIVEHS